MEASRLGVFFGSVTDWPTTSAQVALAAEALCALMKTPFAALWVFDVGIQSMHEGRSLEDRSDDLLLKLRELERGTPVSSGTPVRWPGFVAVPIGRSRALGWLVIEPSNESEILLIAAAKRLEDLAEIHTLRSELSTRDQFLSIASHELKTPLTSIYGILQLQERMLRPKPNGAVSASPAEQEKQRSFFRLVIRQVERLNELIDGLLDVSRIQNGRFQVEPTDADAAAILRETVDSRLNVIAHEANARIRVEAPESLQAWLDPVRFEEIITNLGMNAIRFSPEGGVIWMKLAQDGESLRLLVRDQGPAIPESDQARIFKPFEQAQRTSRLRGLGLGLFISRQIAQLHGGGVELSESVAGRGNVFEASIPLKPPGQQQAAARAAG